MRANHWPQVTGEPQVTVGTCENETFVDPLARCFCLHGAVSATEHVMDDRTVGATRVVWYRLCMCIENVLVDLLTKGSKQRRL